MGMAYTEVEEKRMVANTIHGKMHSFESLTGHKPKYLYLGKNDWRQLIEETKNHMIYDLQENTSNRMYCDLKVRILEQALHVGVGI